MKSLATPAAMFRRAAVLMLAAVFLAPAPNALGAEKGDPAFNKWWQKFQLAVMRRDIRSIDKGVEFPMDWQISDEIRAARTETDLAANFNLFFTPDVMKNVAAGKPEKVANGNYVLNFKVNGKDRVMTFRYYAGTYALDSLVEAKP